MADVDSETIRRVLCGERDAYRVLMDRHFASIFRLTLRITGNEPDAEEAAQDAFLRAYNKLPEFRQTAGFGTWVYRIAMNCSLNLVERRSREASFHAVSLLNEQGSEVFAATAHQGPEQQLLEREAVYTRERALEQLTPMERTAFVLRHMEGRPVAEIAAALGVAENSAKQAIFRAVSKLRTVLRPGASRGSNSAALKGAR